MEVRLEYLRPREVEASMSTCGTLFIPLGTIEWHGRHNVVGLDAVKAHELCRRAAVESGALVHPAVFGGVGGLDEPHTLVMDPEHSLESNHLRPWVEKLCSEAARQGFKAIILLTGHYGAAQQIAVRAAAAWMSRVLGIPILGTPEYFLALDKEYYGDHAAFFETSIMMHLFPESVDLSQLGEEPHQGVGGKDPKRYANADAGRVYCEAITGRLAVLAKAMPTWNEAIRDRFVRAETTLVERQLSLALSEGHVWGAWRRIGQGVFNAYPEFLTEQRFEEIERICRDL